MVTKEALQRARAKFAPESTTTAEEMLSSFPKLSPKESAILRAQIKEGEQNMRRWR